MLSGMRQTLLIAKTTPNERFADLKYRKAGDEAEAYLGTGSFSFSQSR